MGRQWSVAYDHTLTCEHEHINTVARRKNVMSRIRTLDLGFELCALTVEQL